MNPIFKPAGMITLVNQSSTTVYSGMFPGVVAGKYKFDEILIDLRNLCLKAGVSFVMAEIDGIDLKKKKLCLVGRPAIEYSLLSLNVGTKTNLISKSLRKGYSDLSIPIKPFSESLEFIINQDIYKDDPYANPFVIIGAGFAGIEMAFSLRKRWPKRSICLKVKKGRKLKDKLLKTIKDSNIEILEKEPSNLYPTLICAGNKSFEWIKNSALPLDHDGRVLTNKNLQVLNYPELFAVGDCGVIKGNTRPSSGVWAVRSARPLAKNLEIISKGRGLKLYDWTPQKKAIQILYVNSIKKGSKAFLAWGGILIGPSGFISRFKELIDENFISRFSMSNDKDSEMFPDKEMLKCRGCAAKLASTPLNSALKELDINLSLTEDALHIGELISGKKLIQSVDGFPALISDPWLNGRFLAFHSCSDIWACGGSVISAQSIVNLPSLSNDVQQELLFQVLEGIKSVLTIQGAKLIGGHTLESRKMAEEPSSLDIEGSLTVNGIIEDKAHFWSKGGMKKGDQLLISRPLGTGVIFSAFMNGHVRPFVIDAVLKEMNKSQHEIVKYVHQLESENLYKSIVNASTDITGFGLLGHLSEMLKCTNSNQISMNLEPVRIILEIDKIPFYDGVLELFDKGFESTLSPSNEIFLKNINGDKNLRLELTCNDSLLSEKSKNNILKLLIDPQTCGPLVLSCQSFYAEKLINNGPWKRIGFIC